MAAIGVAAQTYGAESRDVGVAGGAPRRLAPRLGHGRAVLAAAELEEPDGLGGVAVGLRGLCGRVESRGRREPEQNKKGSGSKRELWFHRAQHCDYLSLLCSNFWSHLRFDALDSGCFQVHQRLHLWNLR